jgi:hypothetical protein
MLVVMLLVRLERGTLPERRVELYDRAVTTLMETWNVWRSRSAGPRHGRQLSAERLVRVWGAVAEWMLRNRSTGIVHRPELIRQLVRVLTDRERDDEDPEATATEYLEVAADHAGLMEERTRGVFAFWHPTFQEFLAAIELSTPATLAAKRLSSVAGDPRWHETIRLAIGVIGVLQRDPETATAVTRALLDRDSAVTEDLLHGNLRLAATCLADGVRLRKDVAEEIITRLVDVVLAYPYAVFVEPLVQALRGASQLRPVTASCVHALVTLASKHEDHATDEARYGALRLLATITDENADARAVCHTVLGDGASTARRIAAVGLLRAGVVNMTVVDALLSHYCVDDLESEAVAEYCSRGPLERRHALALALRNATTPPKFLRLIANTRIGSEPFVSVVKTSLHMPSALERYEAAYALMRLGVDDLTAGNIFYQALRDRGADGLKDFIHDLGTVGAGERASRDPIVARLLCEPDDAVRLDNAVALLRRNDYEPRCTEVLMQLVESAEPDLSLAAAEALLDERIATTELIEALQRLQGTEPDKQEHCLQLAARAAAMLDGRPDPDSLGLYDVDDEWGPDDDAALDEEERCLDSRHHQLRLALGPQFTAALRFEAASELFASGVQDVDVLEAMRAGLSHPAEAVRLRAAAALAHHTEGAAEIAAIARPLLSAVDPQIRTKAALCLDEIGEVHVEIEAALRAALGTSAAQFGIAARLAKRYPVSDEQLKVFAERMGFVESPVRVLEEISEIAGLPSTVEVVVRLLTGTMPEREACRRVLCGRPLSAEAVASLKQLLRVRATDCHHVVTVRAWLFYWLLKSFEGVSSAHEPLLAKGRPY